MSSADHFQYKLLQRAIGATLAWSCGLSLSVCQAADWGYDEQSTSKQHEETPMRAHALSVARPSLNKAAGSGQPVPHTVPVTTVPGKPAGSSTTHTAAGGSGAAAKTPGLHLTSAAAKQSGAAKQHESTSGALLQAPDPSSLSFTCWAQLYELAAHTKLDDDQRAQLKSLVERKLSSSAATKQDACAIVTFWPKLTSYLIAHPEQRDNYASLMKALLRWKARKESGQIDGAAAGALAIDECALVSEVLGAQRLSVPGNVPFSEDAMDAYADMACFIYEQRNPGKSVDAIDNRAVFASVVSEKFKAAPSQKDKEAMAGFDLSWSKFKIAWTQADEQKKAALLADLMERGAGAAWSQAHDSMLMLVLTHFPGPIVETASGAAADPHK